MFYSFLDSIKDKSERNKKINRQTRHFESNFECLIFRTLLKQKKDVKRVSKILDSISEIRRWTVDLEDWEKVLRIESDGITANQIIQILHDEGVHCSELD